jgi:hypothetical protein
LAAGDLLGWSWMFRSYAWNFTAQASRADGSDLFYGTILREYCEKDVSLGYELLKRISAVMVKRLQAARRKMLTVHTRGAQLEPVVRVSVQGSGDGYPLRSNRS